MLHFCAIKGEINHIVILSLGSNIEPKQEFIDQAVDKISALGPINKQSKYYSTGAWGVVNQNDFINICIEIETKLSAHVLLYKLLAIEQEIGRIRNKKWSPRSIDIDIIYYDDSIINTANLTIPHPEMHNRLFVLNPLAEINKDWEHPIFLKSTNELINSCTDKGKINPCK